MPHVPELNTPRKGVAGNTAARSLDAGIAEFTTLCLKLTAYPRFSGKTVLYYKER
jgi:hypothetical protein